MTTVEPHIFCIMPTTTRRRAWIPRAIRGWLQQRDWPNRSLLVLDGPNPAGASAQEESVRDLVPDDPRIQYRLLTEPLTLGAKYNVGCAMAPADSWIALWADDDWHHCERLAIVAKAMVAEQVDIGGTNTMLVYSVPDKAVYIYQHPIAVPYLIGGTMIFAKSQWDQIQFPDRAVASDTEFVQRLLLREDESIVKFTSILEPRIYVAFVHGQNTGNNLLRLEAGPDGTKGCFKRIDYDLRTQLMGDRDADTYGIARLQPAP